MKGLGVHSHLEHPGNVIGTVDMVILAENNVLLIKRGKSPFKDYWAFPGGRIEQKDTDILTAASNIAGVASHISTSYRELKEETSLTNVDLEYSITVGNNHRDPRGFVLSNIFVGRLNYIPETGIRAGDDAVDYEWFNINNLPDMAFDHHDILLQTIVEKFK